MIARWSMRRRWRLRKSGYIFLIMSLLLLLAAWNTAQNLYYIVWGGVFSFVLLSVVMAPWSLRKLAVRRDAPAAVTRGEPFALMVTLTNQKRRIPSALIRVELAGVPGAPSAFVVKVPGSDSVQFQLTHEYPRRGVYPLPAINLVSTFPFGLIETRRRHDDKREIVVYPRVRALRTALPTHVFGAPRTQRITSADGDEYFSLREYVPGDELRRIAWRASARMGQLLVRELQQASSRHILIRLDSRLPADLPDGDEVFEDVIEAAASLGVTMLNRGYSLSFEAPGVFLAEGEGRAQTLRLLDILARVQPAAETAGQAFADAAGLLDTAGVACIHLSANPAEWGRTAPGSAHRVINPGDLVRA